MKVVTLVRHTTVGAARRGRYIGSSDPPLEDEGLRQARALARIVAARKPDLCWCSPLRRSRQTAEIISTDANIGILEDEDLREIDFGEWEGLTFQEICQRSPQAATEWTAFSSSFAFPGGESVTAFFARTRRVAKRILAHEAKRPLVVAHGGSIRVLLCHLLGLPARHYMAFHTPPASIATVECCGERGELVELNNCVHDGNTGD